MKNQILTLGILLIFLIGVLSGCTDTISNNSGGEYEYTQSFNKEYQTQSNTTLNISTINGNIKVVGHQGNVIKVSGLKKAHKQEDIDKLNLEVTKENNSITLNVKHSTGQWRGEALDLDILVPTYVAVQQLQSTNGKIEIKNIPIIDGASTTNGGITIEIRELNYSITLITTNGNIDVYILPTLHGVFDMKTTNGEIKENDIPLIFDIYTNNFKIGSLQGGGPLIDIQTENGNIELHKLEE